MTFRLLIIASFIIILFSGATYYQFRQIQELKTERIELIAMANDSARQAKIYRDKLGREYSKNTVLTIQRDLVRKLLSSEEFAWTKKFEAVQKNLKNLTQTTKIEARIDTVFAIKSDTRDRPGMAQVLLEDKYNYIAIDSTGSKVELKVEAPIQGVLYWEKPHKFLFLHWGKKRYESEFTCLNPLVHLTNSEVIQVRRK